MAASRTRVQSMGRSRLPHHANDAHPDHFQLRILHLLCGYPLPRPNLANPRRLAVLRQRHLRHLVDPRVATDGALVRWDTADHTYQLFTVPGIDLPARVYERVSVDTNGDLWAAGAAYGEANSVTEVFLTQLTGGRLWRHRDASDGVPAWRPNGDTLGALDDAPAYLVAMSKGRLLTATDRSLQEKVLLFGSPPPDLNDVAVDAVGGTWLALPGTGAAYLLGDDVTIYTAADGLCGNDVLAVAVAPGGAVWFATYGGGICRRHENIWATWASASGLPSDYFVDIAIEPDGTVWSATDSMGAVRFDGASWQSYRAAGGLPDDDVVALAPHPQAGMYFATRDAGVGFFEGTFWRTFAVPRTIPSDRTWAIATHRPASCTPSSAHPRRDPCDEIWIGTDFGAAYSAGDTWTTYTTANGLPGDAIWAIAVDADIPLNLLDFADTGLTPGSRYRYDLRSLRDAVESAAGRELVIETARPIEDPGDCVPYPPEHLVAAASKTRAQLEWRSAGAAGDCPEDTYTVYRSTNGAAEESVAAVGRGSPGYLDYEVAPGSAYAYRVRAVRNGRKSAPSSSAAVTIPRERLVLEVPGTVAFTDTGLTLAPDAAVRVSALRGTVQFHAPAEASGVSAEGLTRSSYYLDWDLDASACDDPLAGVSDAHAMLIARAGGGPALPVGRGARLAGLSGKLELGINDCSLTGTFGSAGGWVVEITEE